MLIKTPDAEVNRVDMRMSEFIPADPELWFSIVDRGFQATGITMDKIRMCVDCNRPALYCRSARYYYEPAERAYETLRAELIKPRLSLSQEPKLIGSLNMRRSEKPKTLAIF